MSQFLSREKWIAIACVLSMLGTAAIMVSHGGADEKLANATQKVVATTPNEVELAAPSQADESMVDDPEEAAEDEADGVDTDKPPLVKQSPAREDTTVEEYSTRSGSRRAPTARRQPPAR